MKSYYEMDDIVSQYCEFHYGQEYFGVENFLTKIVSIAQTHTNKTKKALDIGCSVGRASFELSKSFDSVLGIDYSQSFIDVANRLKDEKKLHYEKKIEGDIKESKTFELIGIDPQKVDFVQGDACDLQEEITGFDLVLAINLIDRLHSPRKFLEDLEHRINPNGICLIASPFTWSEEYVKKENWLGGKIDPHNKNKKIYTIDTIKEIMGKSFELVEDPYDVEFVIQEHSRKYQHSLSTLSIWKKR